MNGGPLSAKWRATTRRRCVDAFYAGEEGGHAIADVLLGEVNPGGKLPYTVYESTDDLRRRRSMTSPRALLTCIFGQARCFPSGMG